MLSLKCPRAIWSITLRGAAARTPPRGVSEDWRLSDLRAVKLKERRKNTKKGRERERVIAEMKKEMR